MALIFIAAGLLSHAVHELVEIGIITFGTSPAFDISGVLPHEGEGILALIGLIVEWTERMPRPSGTGSPASHRGRPGTPSHP